MKPCAFWVLCVGLLFGCREQNERELRRMESNALAAALAEEARGTNGATGSSNSHVRPDLPGAYEIHLGVRGSINSNLPYPLGIDTRVFWGDGRYQIIYNDLHDMKQSYPQVIARGITVLRQRGIQVYLRNANRYFVLDLEVGALKSFARLDDVPIADRNECQQLDISNKGNVYVVGQR